MSLMYFFSVLILTGCGMKPEASNHLIATIFSLARIQYPLGNLAAASRCSDCLRCKPESPEQHGVSPAELKSLVSQAGHSLQSCVNPWKSVWF